jgi:hypothetical protein
MPSWKLNATRQVALLVPLDVLTSYVSQAYTIHWRRAQGFKPISTWNDVFVIGASSKSRKAAKSWMDASKADTQARSSEHRLETGFRNGLKTPRARGKLCSIFILPWKSHLLSGKNLGAVRLEIRRVQGKITVKCIKGQTDSIFLNIIDDEDQGKPPWLIFNFTFSNIAHKKARPTALAAHELRAPPSDISACCDDHGTPSKPLSVSLVSSWSRYLTDQLTSSSTSQAGPRC